MFFLTFYILGKKMIYKEGSKGSEVVKIQKKVGVSSDGVFGVRTKEAVMQWQKANGLVADGIVGNETWKKMFGEDMPTNTKCVDPSVIYDPLTVHITHSQNRSIKYIAIHFTAGSNSKKGRARSTKRVFESRKASADFCVDDVEMVQFNPDLLNYYCWSVGDKNYNNRGGKLYGIAKNSNTISIEVCSTCTPVSNQAVSTDNHKGWSFTNAVLDNAVKLTKILMKKYNVPIERVVRHYDISGKLCPAIYGYNDEPLKDINGKKTGEINNSNKWIAFKERLK